MEKPQQNLSNKRTKKAFTEKEDQLINFFVNLIGTKKWSSIAKYVNGRTAKQCRDRYMNYLKPGLTNIEWKQEEDDLLLDLYSRYGSKWSIINKYFNNRNQVSLKNRLIFLQRHIGYAEKINPLSNNRAQNELRSQTGTNNQNKCKRIKYLLPDIKVDSKCQCYDNQDTHSNNLIKTMDLKNEDSYFNFENIFEISDDFSSFSVFNGENDFSF